MLGIWPTQHADGDYGTVSVNWLTGACVPVEPAFAIPNLVIFLAPALLIILNLSGFFQYKPIWNILQKRIYILEFVGNAITNKLRPNGLQ